MQSGFTGHVTPHEWRWVFVFSILLVGVAFLPFIWIGLQNQQQTDWQFMGALHGHIESSAYLSRIRQGMDGNLLVQYLHTPERHQSVIVQPIYALLGQVSRLAADDLSPILVFHVARVSVTIFMYMALYQLAAAIWVRIRTRRIFFVLASLGSGFGWIWVILTGGTSESNLPVDLTYSHLSPFFSGLVSVHVPLAIACLSLLVAIVIPMLRPGITSLPTVNNSGIVAFVLGIALALLYPEAYIMLATTLIMTVFTQWYFAKKITNREIRWMLWILVPALPILIYYVLVIGSNQFILEWLNQRASQSVNPLQLLFALGGALLVGLPSIIRAIRRFESDGDRYMIIWLMVASFGAFLPIEICIHFLVGIMLPVVYFTTRSIEDVWLKRIHRRYRKGIFALLVIALMLSNVVVLFVPLVPIASDDPIESGGLVLSQEYAIALDWLDARTDRADVVLASPEVSIWIPLWLGAHSVSGHPHETMEFSSRQSLLTNLYSATPDDDCSQLLRRIAGFETYFAVDFVLYGPLEAQYGDGECIKQLPFIASFGDVEVYQQQIQFPR